MNTDDVPRDRPPGLPRSSTQSVSSVRFVTVFFQGRGRLKATRAGQLATHTPLITRNTCRTRQKD